MAEISLTVHLEYDEVVERLKSEGWVIPVRCKDCKHSKGACIDLWGKPAIECITGRTHSRDWFCADGKRKGGDE